MEVSPQRNSSEREFDLIVLGASGFTGQFVVEEVTRTVAKDPIKWAISGRSAKKLRVVLSTATKETGIDVKHIPIIETDISDEKSLRAMTARTRLVLNCVGPYRFFGERVVSACVDTATNQLDISAETTYMESIQLKYHKSAQERGIYIISACGYDIIPLDIGIRFLKNNFDGELNSVENYQTIIVGPQGLKFNQGTWQSAIYEFAAAGQLKNIRRRLNTELFTKRAPSSKFKLQQKVFPFQTEYAKGWCLPFPEFDRSVQRTEQFRYEERNERPTQIKTYFTLPGLLAIFYFLLLGAIFGLFSRFECGRSLLETHPKFFSFGIFSKESPTREQVIDSSSFVITIVGKGWAEKLSEPSDEPPFPPNKTVVVEVRGKDPGYIATSTCLVQSGFTLLRESNKMPKNGGVLTPGAAFAETGLVSRLREYGLTIDLVENY